MEVGKVFQLPNGNKIWIDTVTLNQIPKIGKLITKEEFEKKKNALESKFLVKASVDDNISHTKVDIYYIKHGGPKL
jgi:hypothetical protein